MTRNIDALQYNDFIEVLWCHLDNDAQYDALQYNNCRGLLNNAIPMLRLCCYF